MPAQSVSAAQLPCSQKRPDSALSGPWPRPPPFAQDCPAPSHPGGGSSGHHCSITPLKCVPSWKPWRHLLRKSLELCSPGCLDKHPSTSESKLGTKLPPSASLCSPKVCSGKPWPLLLSRKSEFQFLLKAIQALWAYNQSLPSLWSLLRSP